MHPVEAQLVAYNAREIEPFMRCFAPDVRILNGLGQVVLEGWQAKRDRYAAAFANEPNVRCTVIHRIQHGDFVVDHEHLTGYRDGSEKHAVAIFMVRDGLIAQVQFL